MKLKASNALAICILIAEMLYVWIYFSVIQYNSTEKILAETGQAAVICLIVTTVSIYYVTQKVGFFFCFIVLSYLFAFGQSILISFGFKLPNSPFSISYSGFTTYDIKNSAMLGMLAICTVAIGFCMVIQKKVETIQPPPVFRDEKNLCQIGWVLLIISIIPTFYLLFVDIAGTFSSGYGSTLNAYIGIEKICSLISGFFTSGLLIIFCFERKRPSRVCLYVCVSLYCLLQIAGGSRISVFRLGIVFFVITNLYFKTINKRKALLIFFACLAGTFIFSIVSSARNYIYNIADLSLFIKEITINVWENNFLVASLREMGNTQIINTLVYSKCPSEVGYQYGLSFIKMLWAILPNLIGSVYTGHVGVDITFSALYTKTSSGLGASYISEGYWNFGWLSLIYFILFGYILGKVEMSFNKACNSKNIKATTMFLLVYSMYYMIFMVRSELIGFGRAFVFYAIIPVLLSKVRIGDRKGINFN